MCGGYIRLYSVVRKVLKSCMKYQPVAPLSSVKQRFFLVELFLCQAIGDSKLIKRGRGRGVGGLIYIDQNQNSKRGFLPSFGISSNDHEHALNLKLLGLDVLQDHPILHQLAVRAYSPCLSTTVAPFVQFF